MFDVIVDLIDMNSHSFKYYPQNTTFPLVCCVVEIFDEFERLSSFVNHQADGVSDVLRLLVLVPRLVDDVIVGIDLQVLKIKLVSTRKNTNKYKNVCFWVFCTCTSVLWVRKRFWMILHTHPYLSFVKLSNLPGYTKINYTKIIAMLR